MLITLPQIIYERMTEVEFAQFCADMREYRVERNKDGNIIIMLPTYSETGRTNNEIAFQVTKWNKEKKLGVVFDSSTGFKLLDSSIKSADVAWLSSQKWNQLTTAEKKSFAPVCPDFVIELKSSTDELSKLKAKMEEWLENGVQLAWLIAPETETCYIFRANGTKEEVEGFDKKLSGESVLPDFELILSELQ